MLPQGHRLDAATRAHTHAHLSPLKSLEASRPCSSVLRKPLPPPPTPSPATHNLPCPGLQFEVLADLPYVLAAMPGLLLGVALIAVAARTYYVSLLSRNASGRCVCVCAGEGAYPRIARIARIAPPPHSDLACLGALVHVAVGVHDVCCWVRQECLSPGCHMPFPVDSSRRGGTCQRWYPTAPILLGTNYVRQAFVPICFP